MKNEELGLSRMDNEVPVVQQPQDLLAMAVQKGADVSTLERLMVVRKELRAEAAEAAFNEAMSGFQSECPIVIRNKAGHQNRYNYAPIDTIVKIVTPYLKKYGFSHEEDSIVVDGWVEGIVTVKHKLGHSIVKRFKVPTESSAGMSAQQKYSAALTFALRRAFCMALGIQTADRDTDCPPQDESPTQLKAQLWELLKPVRGTEQNWKAARQWLCDECVIDPDADLPAILKNAAELRVVIEKSKGKL